MNNIVMIIAEIRKIVTLAIIVYIFYTVAIPAINIYSSQNKLLTMLSKQG